MDPDKNKKLLILIFILFAALIILGLIWFFLSQNSDKNTNKPTTTEKTASSSAKTATSSSNPPAAESDLTLITKALVEKTQIATDQISVIVSQNDGKYAKGFVGTKGEETGGGYFLAVKVNGAWIIVYDGQATPDCATINSYGFPVSMVPECLDANGNLIKR